MTLPFLPPVSNEPLDYCECCGRALHEGDMVFSYDDGPTMCWQHAPTWSELKSHQDELIAGGLFESAFGGARAAKKAREEVLSRIANGEGDMRVASPL